MVDEAIPDSKVLRAKLNGEASKIGWLELQRYYAAGKVIQVGSTLDLIDVALRLVADNSTEIEKLIRSGEIAVVQDQQAAAWVEINQQLWAIVVAPWVLVQDKNEQVPIK